MSIDLLYDHENLVKQTIKDDMESLLYVVLYCALHWLPHNLSKDRLSDLITAFFEHREQYCGAPMGARGKIINAENRYHTRGVVYGNPEIKAWLDTAMDYMSPLAHQKEAYKDKWNPDQLDAFWNEFLQSHQLEADDRVSHDLTKRTLLLEASTSDSGASSPLPASEKRHHSPSTPIPTDTKRMRSTRSTRHQPVPVPAPEVQLVRVTRQSTKRRLSSPGPIAADTKRTRSTHSTRPRSGPSEDTSLRRSTRNRGPAVGDAAAERQTSIVLSTARGSAPRGRGRGATAAQARSASTSRGRGGRGTAPATSGRGGGTRARGDGMGDRGATRGRGERKAVSRKMK